MRHKNRYLLVKVEFEEIVDGLSRHAISSRIREKVAEIYGLVGLSKCTSLTIKYYSPVTSLMIMRCSHEFHREILACLALVSKIKDHPVSMSVIHVSGTIVKVQNRIIELDKEAIAHLLQEKKISQKRSLAVGEKNKMEIDALAD